jgi:hypothetical protein
VFLHYSSFIPLVLVLFVWGIFVTLCVTVTNIFQWDDDDEVHFTIHQHAELDFYSASPLKQQSMGRHVATHGHIILIPNQPVFDLSPSCYLLNGEATKYRFQSLWFDPIGNWIHHLPHSRRARYPLLHRCGVWVCTLFMSIQLFTFFYRNSADKNVFIIRCL